MVFAIPRMVHNQERERMKPLNMIAGLTLTLGSLFAANAAHAIVTTIDTNANSLAAAVSANAQGFTVNSATLSGHSNTAGAASSGTYTNASATYKIGAGIVLSTGDVMDYADGPNNNTATTTGYNVNANAAQQAILSAIGGNALYRDVTQLDINFSTSTGNVFFNTVFGSEEYPEFRGSFVD